MKLEKFSFGTGDRFGMQGKAQLQAIINAKNAGIDIVPVWNKSSREHQIIHTSPEEVRVEADQAVKELGWNNPYYVDADHINMGNVDSFIPFSDFFTIDVADYIGRKADSSDIEDFIKKNLRFTGKLEIPGLDEIFEPGKETLYEIANKYLYAIKQAGLIYRHIESKKGKNNFITEVSMDEVNDPQTPLELFFILSALSEEKIPVQTIAPKFTGRFNKGVDYEGNLDQFSKEFHADLRVIDRAIDIFNLPANLKLSVHSGSDKFSIYPIMGDWIHKLGKGIHVKTAGTTWLEEVIGMALSGGEALDLAKSIYHKALERKDELCGPYATVIDINDSDLPSASVVNEWSGEELANALRHIPGHPDYNPGLRQLIHVGYKIAAEYSNVYISMIRKNEKIVSEQVTDNIFERHIKRLFGYKFN